MYLRGISIWIYINRCRALGIRNDLHQLIFWMLYVSITGNSLWAQRHACFFCWENAKVAAPNHIPPGKIRILGGGHRRGLALNSPVALQIARPCVDWNRMIGADWRSQKKLICQSVPVLLPQFVHLSVFIVYLTTFFSILAWWQFVAMLLLQLVLLYPHYKKPPTCLGNTTSFLVVKMDLCL